MSTAKVRTTVTLDPEHVLAVGDVTDLGGFAPPGGGIVVKGLAES